MINTNRETERDSYRLGYVHTLEEAFETNIVQDEL